jgi:plastocyanin
VAVANGVVYSLNDATGTLQAFDASSGAELLAHAFMSETQSPMHDMGNSSGVSVARNMVFATSQSDGTSTLFALKLGATGDPDGGNEGGGEGGGGGGGEEPPDDGGGGSGEATIATGPGAQSYGYLTPTVTISKGRTASYTNLDAIKHNVSSPEGLFRSELADGGTTVPVVGVEKLEPGTYEFLCDPHPNMKGKLTVR